MLSSDHIKRYITDSYKELTHYAISCTGWNFLRQGLDPAEFVNEGMLTVFDRTDGFNDFEEFSRYIKSAIKSSILYYQEGLKSSNFVAHYAYVNKDGNNYSIENGIAGSISYQDAIDRFADSESFMKIYSLFESARFDKYKSAFFCHKCTSSRYFKLNRNEYKKCAGCGHVYSITCTTHLHNTMLSFDKWYKLLKCVLQNPDITLNSLSRTVGITITTASKRKRLILGASKLASTNDLHVILSLLLKPKKEPILPVTIGVFSTNDAEEIRRLFCTGYSRRKLMDIYSKSYDSICDVIANRSYIDVNYKPAGRFKSPRECG